MNKVLLYIGMFFQDAGIASIAVSAALSSPALSAAGAILFVAGGIAIFGGLWRADDEGRGE